MKYKVYGTETCPFCTKAKDLLESKGLEYEYIGVRASDEALQLFESNGWKTVPQIFKDEEHIGGFSDLQKLLG